MGNNCASLVTDFVLFCHERYFMLSISESSEYNQADVIEAFNTTSNISR